MNFRSALVLLVAIASSGSIVGCKKSTKKPTTGTNEVNDHTEAGDQKDGEFVQTSGTHTESKESVRKITPLNQV